MDESDAVGQREGGAPAAPAAPAVPPVSDSHTHTFTLSSFTVIYFPRVLLPDSRLLMIYSTACLVFYKSS